MSRMNSLTIDKRKLNHYIMGHPANDSPDFLRFGVYTMDHSIIITEAQMELLHELIAAEIRSQRHWACNHLSFGSVADAMNCAHRVDALKPLYAATNISAKRRISEASGNPLKLVHSAA